MPAPATNPNGTPTSSSVTTSINNVSQSTGVSSSLLTAIAQQESTYGQDPNSLVPNSDNAVGVMQLTPIDLQQLQNEGHSINPYDPDSNILGGALTLQDNLNKFNGDQDAAIAAYFEGIPEVQHLMNTYGADWQAHLPPKGAAYLNDVNQKLGNNDVSSGNPTPTNGSNVNNDLPAGESMPDPIAASPLPIQAVSQDQLNAINPPLVDYSTLNNQPWYADTNLLTGNPRLKNLSPQGFPIVFEVYMDQTTPNSLLTTTQNGTTPVLIPLNCSLERFHIASRHVVTRTPTRTGFFLTMWGMAADVIEGSGSTGVFMNQFGLTDFLSLSGTNTDAVNAVLGAYGHSPSGVNVTEVALPSGNPAQPATPLTASVVALNAAQIRNGNVQGLNSSEPFRIAAEDAFIEFMSLFQMNGTTWLHSTGFGTDPSNQATDIQNNANQTAALAVYSTGIGATDIEIKAKNNDVYKRGFVVMKFRNSQYLGFFKSLSWVMDAERPYQWKFSFTFQVERTLSMVYYASPAAGPMASNTSLASSGAPILGVV